MNALFEERIAPYLENDPNNMVYLLEAWRSTTGEYGATVYAGFRSGELPHLDEREYNGEKEIRLNDILRVTVSGSAVSESTEIHTGEGTAPVLGHFMTAHTDPAHLKEEAGKFAMLAGSGAPAQRRQAVFWGRGTVEQFVRMLPSQSDSASFVIQRAFSNFLPRGGSRLDVRV